MHLRILFNLICLTIGMVLINSTCAFAQVQDIGGATNDFSTKILTFFKGPLAIGLAVITILILAITASAGIRDNARIQAAAGSVQTLRSAADNFLSNGNLNYSGISVAALKTANLLPSGFDANNANPWGGSVAVAPDTDPTHFKVVLGSVGSTEAGKLSSFFRNNVTSSHYDASGSLWTAIF